MNIERKTFSAAEFKVVDSVQGIAEMVVSVFNNLDDGNDVVMPGFFAESIARRRTSDGRPKAKGVWMHDWSTPIAKTLDAKEIMPGDPLLPPRLSALGGLWVKAQFNLETQRGREAFSDLQFGTIDEFSFGYQTKEYNYDEETGVRKLVKGEWYEWSPVLVGMNDQTVLLGTKEIGGLTLAAHAEAVRAAVQSFGERVRSVKELRAKEGRPIKEERRKEMAEIADALDEASGRLRVILKETEPAKTFDASTLFVAYQRIVARQNGVPIN